MTNPQFYLFFWSRASREPSSFSGMFFLGTPKLARAEVARSRYAGSPASRSPAGGFCLINNVSNT